MRISTSQIFSQSLTQMNTALNDLTQLNEINSTQKKLNRPSDDPSGMGKVMELSSYEQSLDNYIESCETAGDYLTLADEILTQASEYVSSALELAEQASTETYTEDQLEMIAEELKGVLESLLAIANTTQGSDSIFAGQNLQDDAYSVGLGVTLPNDSLSNASFTSFSGETDSTIAVEFTSDGTIGTDELEYQYSTDGGDTWTTGTLAAGDTELDLEECQVELASGTTITAMDDDGEGSQFYLREALVYTGTDTAMTVDISNSSSVEMTSVGSEIFGGWDSDSNSPYGDPNLFESICDCIAYMEMGDYDGVADCIDSITEGQEILLAGAANVGARENQVTYTEQAQSIVQEMTTNSISNVEDADATQVLIELEQANYVYEAVLSSSADIMTMSLLNYI